MNTCFSSYAFSLYFLPEDETVLQARDVQLVYVLHYPVHYAVFVLHLRVVSEVIGVAQL